MERIKEIFNQHYGNYDYRRITAEEILINRKKVKRLMKIMELFSKAIRKRSRYSSYKVTVGKIAENKINRHFGAVDINNVEKVYLSPILGGFNGEIIVYDVSIHLILIKRLIW